MALCRYFDKSPSRIVGEPVHCHGRNAMCIGCRLFKDAFPTI